MNRKFFGNQYIGKTWRTVKLIVAGTWIGIKEMFHNPGKVLLAVLMLGLALATFIETSTPHRLKISEAWADLTTEEEVKYVREEAPEEKEEPAVIMERIDACESRLRAGLPGAQFNADGTLRKHVNKDGSVDYGKFMINDRRHEHKAVALEKANPGANYNIYTLEGNTNYAYHLYETEGTEPWIWSKPCWVNAKWQT